MNMKDVIKFERRHDELTIKAHADEKYLPDFAAHLLGFMQRAQAEIGKICPVSRTTAPVYAAVFYKFYTMIYNDMVDEAKGICDELIMLTEDAPASTITFEVDDREGGKV